MDRPKGFSLSEVLVVLTVILILAALLLATIGDVYVLGQRVACQHRLQQLHHACQMFSNKHRGRELRYLDLLGGDSGRWYEKLLPFLGAESVAEAGDYINCPCAELAETDGLIGGGRGLGLPVLIYRTVSAASYGSYEGVRDDLRASEVFFGGCDLVHYGEPEEAGIVSRITAAISS